jgi:hypothetical protein
MKDATIIYCSSNQEKPDFEQRIRDNILKVRGDLPIISISQKPIKDFGKNIVVGDDIGVSGFNFFRQVQIGLKEAKTRFVISAEADCLYPPDYFTYRPPRDDMCYRDSNLYVMPDQRDFFFYKKEGATHAQIVNRKFYLSRLNKLFKGAPQWSAEEKNFPKERWKKEDIFDHIEHYQTENPVFQVKTHRGLRYFTHSSRIPIPEIPYWGSGKKCRAYYLHGKVINDK